MLEIETIHHFSVCVTDLARARQFYGGTLGLRELPRPCCCHGCAFGSDVPAHGDAAGSLPALHCGGGVSARTGALA